MTKIKKQILLLTLIEMALLTFLYQHFIPPKKQQLTRLLAQTHLPKQPRPLPYKEWVKVEKIQLLLKQSNINLLSWHHNTATLQANLAQWLNLLTHWQRQSLIKPKKITIMPNKHHHSLLIKLEF